MTRARDLANLVGSGNFSSTTFTATAGQTAFTISHTQGFVQVFMNGLLLDETADYTSNGTAITLTSGASVGDEIEVVAYNTFSVGDAQTQTAADARYVNTAGDNMSGNLTTTGSIGVGTTSPSSLIDIHANSSTAYSATAEPREDAIIHNINGADGSGVNNHATLGFHVANGATSQGFLNYVRTGDNTGAFTVSQRTGGSSYAEHLKINSSGHVTKPYQPAFFARHTTAAAYSSAYVTNWSTVTYNVGNHFAGSTGIFTAPVAGVYQLNAMIGNNYANGAGNYNVKVNDVNVSGLIFDPYASQNTWASSILVGQVKISANDTVKIYCSGAGYPDNSSWTSWSMCLLG